MGLERAETLWNRPSPTVTPRIKTRKTTEMIFKILIPFPCAISSSLFIISSSTHFLPEGTPIYPAVKSNPWGPVPFPDAGFRSKPRGLSVIRCCPPDRLPHPEPLLLLPSSATGNSTPRPYRRVLHDQ